MASRVLVLFMMSKNRSILVLTACCCLALSSCRQEQAGTETAALSRPVLKAEVVRGPLSFRILLDKEEIDIRDTFTVTLEAESDENYTFQFPKFGTGMEQFAIVDYHTETPRLNEQQKMLYRRSYILEPLLSENYQIPAQRVFFQENGLAGKQHELETEPFSIEVKLPPAEFWDNLDIDAATGMEPLQRLGRARREFTLLYVGAAALLLAAVIIWLLLRRRQQQESVSVIPAHIKAFQALQELLTEELLKKQQFKLFYGRISDILRTYIEDRFGLRAPEQTTEEFLAALAVDNTLSQEHKRLLQDFLTHCDLVKFAEYSPAEPEIKSTFSSCKEFISQTLAG